MLWIEPHEAVRLRISGREKHGYTEAYHPCDRGVGYEIDYGTNRFEVYRDQEVIASCTGELALIAAFRLLGGK